MASKPRRRQSVCTADLFTPEEHFSLQDMVEAGESSSRLGDSVQVRERAAMWNDDCAVDY